MKVAQYEKPHILNVTTKPLRTLKQDEVLIKVEACGICGTDVHIVDGASRSSPPVVIGHEFAGVVEGMGRGVVEVAAGQRVAVDPNISCASCFFCRRGIVHLCSDLRALGVDLDGGMAEYCIVPAKQIHTLPQSMSAEVCAFIEPVSCAIHGVDLANIRAGDTVVILGGGAIGLIMLQLARDVGAARIILVEPLEYKRALASQLKADIALDPNVSDVKTTVHELTQVGADVVIECAGKVETAQLALELARRGGLVEFFGVCPIGENISVEPNKIYFKEMTIVGSYVNPHTFARSIGMLQSGKVRVDGFLLHRFPLDGVHEALQFQREGRTIKSVLLPGK